MLIEKMREAGVEPARLSAQEPKSQAANVLLSLKLIACKQFNDVGRGESIRISPLSPYFAPWIESITASAIAVSSNRT